MNFALVPIFLALGAFVGFLAGLLGIGGGFTIVPVLMEVFEREGVLTAHVLPLAIGTSAATIVFTAVSSTRAHHARGAVDWFVVRAMAPGLVLGSLIGPQIASALPRAHHGGVLRRVHLVRGVPHVPQAAAEVAARSCPARTALFGVGAGIGVMSGMVGTGGAFIAVPFLTKCRVPMAKAVATSAALGVPIAIAATAGYIFAGWGKPGLPPYAIGYIYLPALVAIAVASTLLAPFGARMAHRWPVARLRTAFATMLFVLGAYMLWKAARG